MDEFKSFIIDDCCSLPDLSIPREDAVACWDNCSDTLDYCCYARCYYYAMGLYEDQVFSIQRFADNLKIGFDDWTRQIWAPIIDEALNFCELAGLFDLNS